MAGPRPIRFESGVGETVYVDLAGPVATGLHQVDNPVIDRGRQPLRHLQRHAWSAGAGLDLSRGAQRHARNVLIGDRQPDVDGVRPEWPSLRLEPVRGHRISDGGRRERRAVRDRPRHRVRSRVCA